jgi:peptide/nickel transport system permease protein
MGAYIIRRFLYMLLLLWFTTMVSYAIIALPPGDYLTSYVAQLRSQGEDINEEQIAGLRRAYGLGEPEYVQYLLWLRQMVVERDFGRSFAYRQPVSQLLLERLPATLLVSIGSTLVVYLLAIPIGIYSAVRQYSPGDYVATIVGFVGLAVPNFLLALVLMLFFYRTFGVSVGGLTSPQYETAPWSLAKALDLLVHLPVPWLVIGAAGAASVIRVMRATLLDELNRPYVETARAKGVSEWRLLLRYPVRVALNPIASTVGWVLPSMFSGAVITSIVLGLPTVGPILLQALLNQDMFLAASIVLILTALTLIGTFISDMLLMVLDPRIRLEGGQ